jgi:hypothetical protein
LSPCAPYELTSHVSVFSHDFKRLERFAKLATSSAYVGNRQHDGAANATINRELETLGKMLKLAYENNKLMRLPIIHKLAANPPRQGFFELDRFEAVRSLLRPDHQFAVSIAHAFGWRIQSEVLTLERT